MKLKLIIVIVIIVAAVFLFSRKTGPDQGDKGTMLQGQAQRPENNIGTGTPTPAVLIPKVHTINITDTGFLPNLLTIKPGDTVNFVNTGATPHWPASGTHPIHQICPGLDASKSLNPGEKYSFTFKEVKECPVHDHLNPSLKGKIIVQ